MKICVIENCEECKYSAYYISPPGHTGSCLHVKNKGKKIENIYKMPKWCPLEDKI